MATFFLAEAGETPGCHPLTLTRSLGDFPLANIPLRRHQAAALLAPKARFEDFDADGDGLLAWNELRQAVSLREQPRPRYEPPESRLESR